MREAFEKAGILLPEQRLRKILGSVPEPSAPDAAMKALVASQDVEAALALFDPVAVASRLNAKMKEIGRASQLKLASQRQIDRPATHAEPNGASRVALARRSRNDRPVRPAPATKISRAGALAVARSSVFDLRIGAEMRYGGLTRFDCVQLKRKGIVVNHVADRLLTEVKWPDDHTPLERCASEALAKDIHDSAYSVLTSLVGAANAAA